MTESIERRSIRIETLDGAVEGHLQLPTKLRTLDDLNIISNRFIVLHQACSSGESWSIGDGPLLVNKDAVLLVSELGEPPRLRGAQLGTFTRKAVRFRMKGFEVQGFVHVPPGGAPLKRIQHDGHPFVALTSVLVSGAGGEIPLPFVAVNRERVLALQEAAFADSPDEEAALGAELTR